MDDGEDLDLHRYSQDLNDVLPHHPPKAKIKHGNLTPWDAGWVRDCGGVEGFTVVVDLGERRHVGAGEPEQSRIVPAILRYEGDGILGRVTVSSRKGYHGEVDIQQNAEYED